MLDLLCLGEAMIEFNQQTTDHLYKRGYGGDTSNTAVAAARLGASVGYISRVGSDAFGQDLLALWKREQVSSEFVTTDKAAPTGLYVVTHHEERHHFQYYRRGSAASRLSSSDMPVEAIKRAKMLHLSAISQAISETACQACFTAIDATKRAGTRVCYDSNLRLALWPLEQARLIILKSIGLADIFRPSLDDARVLLDRDDPDDIMDVFLAMGPQLVAMTLGDGGVLVASRGQRRRLSGYKVDVVDATGAGDAFNGALLARLLAGDEDATAADFANAAAAISVTGYGAIPSLPTMGTVQAFMAAHSVGSHEFKTHATDT